MKKHTLIPIALALASSLSPAYAGTLFVSGHDADAHYNAEYINVALNYAGSTGNAAFFYNAGNYTSNLNAEFLASGYNHNLVGIAIGSPAYYAALAGGYSTILIGSGYDAISAAGSATLNADAGLFATFFNANGNIVSLTDQGLGQSFYNFIPSFGSTINNSISTSNQFSVTAAGTNIGFTESIVDADITHSYFTGIDASIFTVFETYNVTGDAVAFGFTGQIQCDPTDSSSSCYVPLPPPKAVPVPAAIWLLGSGLFGMLGIGRRNKA